MKPISSLFAVWLTYEPTDSLSVTLSMHYSYENSTPASAQVENTEVPTDLFGGIIPGVLDLNGAPIGGLLDTGSTDPRGCTSWYITGG